MGRVGQESKIVMVLPGTWLVLATLSIIILMFWLGYYWARTHGQFDDVEAAKYAMLKNDREYHNDDS
jgi:nitrogen fixation-related uncharacterized protein